MVRQTKLSIEELKEKAEELWKVDNTIVLEFLKLHAYVNRAVSNDSHYQLEKNVTEAEEALNAIRDAIWRFDNGLPQEYEEEAR